MGFHGSEQAAQPIVQILSNARPFLFLPIEHGIESEYFLLLFQLLNALFLQLGRLCRQPLLGAQAEDQPETYGCAKQYKQSHQPNEPVALLRFLPDFQVLDAKGLFFFIRLVSHLKLA